MHKLEKGMSLRTKLGIGVASMIAAAGSAMAQTGPANEGVGAIKTAIDGLKPDLGTIVVAAVAVCLIGIGAAVALGVGKRLIGK